MKNVVSIVSYRKERPTTICSPTGGILPVNVNYRHLEVGSDPEGDRRPATGG
jgi:hypothetical protein